MVSATCNIPCSFSIVVGLIVRQQLTGLYFILRSIYIKNSICFFLLVLQFLSWKQMDMKLGLPCISLGSPDIHSFFPFSCPRYGTQQRTAGPLPLPLHN